MPGRPTKRAGHARRGVYARNRGATVFFCGCVISALALLIVTSFTVSPRALPPVPAEIPVAMIQLMPDRHGLCRHLFFHNDSGRFDEGGSGRCLIPDDQLLTTIRGKRNAAIAQAFKFR